MKFYRNKSINERKRNIWGILDGNSMVPEWTLGRDAVETRYSVCVLERQVEFVY